MPVAHYLTLVRIFVGPLFLLTYLYHAEKSLMVPLVLTALLACAELSDALDGYLARKYNQVTDLGKVLDPMADSIYRISVFLTFTLEPVKLPMGLIFIFLYRDSVISTLRTICALKGFALAARPSGKIKAAVQAIASFAILALLLLFTLHHISQEQLTTYSIYIVTVAGLYTLYSGTDYILANWPYIKKALSPKPIT